MDTDINLLFPNSYETSRERFRDDLSLIQVGWPHAKLDQHTINAGDDLTIDWIRADATAECKRMFILTTGQHGAEGYVGSAMMQLAVEEYLSRLNSQNTGLLLVHTINPWGMKYMRRVNANNVDLNRNFAWEESDLNAAANPNYVLLNNFLNPQKPVGRYTFAKIYFFFHLLRILVSPGQATLRSAMLMGQYQFPQGLYFGGTELQEETRLLMNLYRDAIRSFDEIVHMDMHTGYGPRSQMSLVNSPLEHRSPRALAHAFDYPLVVAATPAEFYSINGDMVDWIYQLHQEEFPGKRLYATAFEFGTMGDSLLASIRSMRVMVLENQAYWFGISNPKIERGVREEFQALFSPQEQFWREKAVADARQAFEGILSAEGFIDGTA
ncbi:MAG: DUF2817 domain-containing protein [Anaerolineales bacterium]|nr:DUF2817 domain-containing protein [Chloroflexota bacterium]MBL6979775.1 DUF2817 domain-containing protein [Anaerolineales bacterium]